ncbi:hypothetical protein SMACR_07809 [Sordaria macrospora]|uniref:WGS project CABT00000000 data, contig 2.41 n=2 Tax=Sordaria macrospora TaxID=5147 RepID=F7W7Y4_SORMK|nr:uncharacterized protein SMAC_07809 [Sordaria macrospora k-hell]KAA8629933.1 hypothetical protein SMACR_07809 [Sordaria macrospora]KAH7635618.1 hypothetical protein B0T09DRAFT_379415 [Sordaria sp. MPI-SDFR-AT-0083]WPJ64121.1 hypothetical protein SMAC4_07809 [Sordaria macrospora]CCC13627.1 unnamed protein product [Sordaria macrospora k-hell]
MVAQYGSGPGAAAAGLGVGSLGVGGGDRDVSTLAIRGTSSVVGGAGGTGVRANHRDSYSHHGHGHGHGHHSSSNNNFNSSQSYVSSRTRRYNRSHAGGASFVPQNEFPIFSHSGDVEIVVRVPCGLENRYLLHRHILTRCSGFFEASTSQEWSRATTVLGGGVPELPAPGSASKSGSGNVAETGTIARTTQDSAPTKRWRYELDTGTDDNDIPMLVQKEESSPPPIPTSLGPPPTHSSIFGNGTSSSGRHRSNSQKSTHQSNSFFRSVANLSLSHSSSRNHHNAPPPAREEPSQADLDLLRDYDNLFRIMYNYPPTIDPISLPDAYVQCKSLLQLADQYDALAVVGPRVDHHLLQFQSRLWRQIAKYPISYLRLGYLARSKVIFQEALIHVVGQWPAGERSIRAAMPESVVDIIEDKVDELEEVVSRVEARLFRLGLTGRGGERVGPGNGYVDWLAVSFFREWLAENTSPPSSAEYTSSKHPPQIPERTRGGHRSGNSNNVPGSRNRHNSSSSGSASGSNTHSASASARDRDPYAANAPTNTPAHLSTTPLATLGRTFRLLGGSPKEYLTHDDCKRFLKLSPELYNRDNLRRFEKRIEELKAMAREVVRPLMGSGLELEISGGGSAHPTAKESSGGANGGASGGGGAGSGSVLGYLTCTTVYDRDLPWMSYDQV